MSTRREPKVVAVVLPAEAEYSSRLLEGAIQYADTHRHIHVLDLPFSRNGKPRLGDLQSFDGALVWLLARDTWVRRLLAAGIPIVNTSGDWPRTEIPAVAFDGDSVITDAVEHLARLGRTELAFVGFEMTGILEFEARLRRFRADAARYHLPVRTCELGVPSSLLWLEQAMELSPKATERLKKFLGSLRLPAGVWCENDYIGLHVCQTARALGLEIPTDLAVLGMFDYRIARTCVPPLSSIPQPGQAIGYEAMRLLDRKLMGGISIPAVTCLPSPPISWRESTGGGQAALDYLQRARQLIHQHAAERISVARIAALVRTSQKNLTIRFAQAFGRTPGEEIRRARTTRAKHYLATTHSSVAEIAGLCGYDEQSKFTKFFKRETGLTPLVYRKQSHP